MTTPLAPTPQPPASQPSLTDTTFPRHAQWAAAALLFVALVLIGGHVLSMQRFAARPTELAPRLDLNHADEVELRQLPGLGPVRARRIVEHRRAKDGFKSVDDLRKVSGIGPATLDLVRPFLVVEDEPEEEAEPAPVAVPVHKPAPQDPSTAAVKWKKGKKGDALAGPIDVNRATAEELQQLPGIGPALAQRIIQTRRQQPFSSVKDLRRVPGIGPKTLERLRPFVTVGNGVDTTALAQ